MLLKIHVALIFLNFDLQRGMESYLGVINELFRSVRYAVLRRVLIKKAGVLVHSICPSFTR